jgi:hypothetical protein
MRIVSRFIANRERPFGRNGRPALTGATFRLVESKSIDSPEHFVSR